MRFVSLWTFLILLAVRLADPYPTYLPLLGHRSLIAQSPVVIAALLFDGLLPYEPDEAFALVNVRAAPLMLDGWSVSDGTRVLTLPPLNLPPGREVWCAREATAFVRVMGFLPACEYGRDTHPDVPNAQGRGIRFTNRGGTLILYTPEGRIADALVYKTGPVPSTAWRGAPLTPTPGFAQEGQILYRKWSETASLPLPDTNTPRDWAQDPTDLRRGRRVRYPGWGWETFRQPAVTREFTTAVLGVTPDTGTSLLAQWLSEAQERIDIAVYTFTSREIADVLARRAAAGVRVRVLVDGNPVGGLPPETLPLLAELVRQGVAVGLLATDPTTGTRRYRYMHAKYAVVDGRWLIISTENFGPESFPPSSWGRNRGGRRGFLLRIDATPVVQRAEEMFAYDFNARFGDVQWLSPQRVARLPSRSVALAPPEYRWQFTTPITVTEWMTLTLFSAPESALRTTNGLLGLIDRAQSGDIIEVMGLYEDLWWGEEGDDPARSTNPRWQALFAAAARGATVRVLLDGYFQETTGSARNAQVAQQVNALAVARGWPLTVRTGNPTGLGVHAKVWLFALGRERWVVLTSLNGSEVSHKVNREIALGLASRTLYEAVREVFLRDWRVSQPP